MSLIKKFAVNVCWITFWSLVTAESICEQHKTVFTTSLTGIISDGPSDYMPNQRCEWLIRSPNVTRYPYIGLKFHSTFTECSYDYIIVHDGDSYSSPLLATLSGGSASLTSVTAYQLLSRSGNMLVYLFSDMNKEFKGFNASFKISECPNDCSNHGICENNRCVCDENWIGFDCRQRICYENCGAKGSCRIESLLKKCRCISGNIGKTCKMSLNDDSENWWDLVYDYNGETGSDGIAGHTGVYLDPHFYIFGGFNLNGPVAKLLRYNFQDNEWLLLEPSTQPSARFFHSMNLVSDKVDNSHHLFIYGGDLGRDRLSDETWIFDTLSDSWRKHTPLPSHSPPPSLCQHTATLVEIDHQQYIYLFGGRTSHSRSEGLSSDMYRFDWAIQKWEKIIYDPAGTKSYKLRAAGHTVVYDKIDQTLVLFGGLRMDSEQMVVHSSSVFLYSIASNRWAEIAASEPLSSATYNIDALAFHTANVVGDYMVVHGGSVYRPEPNLCFSRQTHFYNLRCHAWVKGLLKAMSAPNRVFGHAASVINDSVLLVHGGYNGVMSGELHAFKLPKTDVDYDRERNERECSRHDEESCSSDYLNRCIWTGHHCIVSENEHTVCGSVCPHLKDCQSCSTFNSYSKNFTSGWIARRCGWCVRDSTCYAVNGGGKLNVCSTDSRKLHQTLQQDINNMTVIQVPDMCLVKNQWSGVVAAEYHSTANFSQPDNVSFLTEVDMKWDKAELNGNHMVKIHAFLLPRSFSQKYLQLQLFAIKGMARILLSSSDNPKDLKEIVTKGSKSDSTEGDPRSGAFSEPILLKSLKNSRHYMVVEFNSSTTSNHWTGKVEVEWATSDTAIRSDEFYPLSFANLEPYRGTIEAGSTTSCNSLTNCLACVMDTSCAWCESRSFCVPKTMPAAHDYYCSPTDTNVAMDSAHFGVITLPGSCIVCSDFPTCVQCTSAAYCEWHDSKCLRRGRTANGIKSHSQCPQPCHFREGCASCLANGDENGLDLRCAWCSTTQKCYKFTRYHLAAYPFGQCFFWVDKLDQCPNCSSHKNCNSCLQTHRCGWCSLEFDPLKGYCTAGEFSSPAATCRVEHLLLNNTLSENDSMNWSYDTCPDINECKLLGSEIEWADGKMLRPCDLNAKCLNTEGSYLCECNPGFKGDGYYCLRTCLHQCVHGTCSEHPNYVCECALGWTSAFESANHTACDTDCKCNFLSFCSRGQGICDSCERNSTGLNCSECVRGHYHIGTIALGCYPCQCNGHGDIEYGLCEPDTGDCFCKDHTRGVNCELCEDGYFGNPRNDGICYRKSGGRIKLHDKVGAFGIRETRYIRSGSIMRRSEMGDRLYYVNCEWIIFPQEKVENLPIIRIEIEEDINVPCYVEKVAVFDGRPDSGDLLLIGEFCGSGWSKSLVLYATSGYATVIYSKILSFARQSHEGFSIKYEVLSICTPTTLSTEMDVVSGDGEYPVGASSVRNSIETTNLDMCIPYTCLNNCSTHGVCFVGLCYCHSNYTGLDCNTFRGNLLSPVSIRVEWNKSNLSEPASRTGHIFLAIDSLLWLHGGVSVGHLLDDLWSYNLSAKTWRSVHRPDSVFPSSRYNHASASNNGKKEFYIYGGILDDGSVSSEMWAFTTADESWKKIADGLASLAGHTMTFCGHVKAYIIGGYGKRAGFNRYMYIYDFSAKSITFEKKLSSNLNMPFFYGHSATCDLENNRIYVFGGLEAALLKIPELSNTMYTLDTKQLKWETVFARKTTYLAPAPRAFHAAFAISSLSVKGFMVVGGKTDNFEATNVLWFFSYKCNNWIKLAVTDFYFSTLESFPMFPSVAFFNNEYYLYGKMPGTPYKSIMLVLSDIEPCLSAKFRKACVDLQLGCVPSIVDDSFICLPPNGDAENECLPFKPDCSSFRNCRSCVEGYKMSPSCYWCEPPEDNERGSCRPESDLCGFRSQVSRKRECDLCSHVPSAQCDSKPGCLWMEAEGMNEHFNKIVKTCTCKQDRMWNDLRATIPAKYFFREPIHRPFCRNCRCPGSCSIHTSCSTCLQVQGFGRSWRFCMWSQKLGKCLDPAFVPLLCTWDGVCGSLASKGPVSCPVSRCEEISYCSKCINQRNCHWIQNEHSSRCLDARNSKNKVVAGTYYYECPPEDECLKEIDECIPDYREKCRDLPQGYECACQTGYNRTSPEQTCTPTCSQGCFRGTCTAPETCMCNFGYTGSSCSISCDCNGHSNCNAESPSVCLACHNNTVGDHCEHCKFGFVGDPVRKIRCQECKDFCGRRSNTCESKISNVSDYGPVPEEARCLNCEQNSWGDRCQKCLDGYFKYENTCKKCQCNGHSETCDESTGGYCKCKNYTTSSDENCNSPNKDTRNYPLDCWKKQCDKCKSSYQGFPENGGYCYKQVSVGQAECISADPSILCSPPEFASDNHHTVDSSENPPSHGLPYGQTLLFAINPKYTNVDIRIIIDVTFGELSLFLSNDSDAFHVGSDEIALKHVTPEEDDRSNSSLEVNGLELIIENASKFNSFAKLLPGVALRVNGIKNRLTVTIPHMGFDFKLTKFYVILLGRPKSHHSKTSKNDLPSQSRNRRAVQGSFDKTAGQLVCRQDQTHIDLFVFFSVFSSCFFLFLSICILTWKLKQAMNMRQARHERDIQMQHMANRPFSTAYVILEDYVPQPLFYSRNHRKIDECFSRSSNTSGILQLFQASSCPVFAPSHTDKICDEAGSSGVNSPFLGSVPSSRYFCSQDYQASGSKQISSSLNSPCNSGEQLIVINRDTDIRKTAVPFFNSMAYIKKDAGAESSGQLLQLSVDRTRSPSPKVRFHPFQATSNENESRLSNFEKRKTFFGTMPTSQTLTNMIDHRAKSCSTPNLPRVTTTVKKCLPKRTSLFKSTDSSTIPRSRSDADMLKPMAFELTEDQCASINTVLMQLPGGQQTPVSACLGSALMAAQSTGNAVGVPFYKSQIRSRNRK